MGNNGLLKLIWKSHHDYNS